MNEHPRDWSRSYWVLVVNQILVVGIVSLLASAMLHEAYRASAAADLYLPGFTRWYFSYYRWVGPIGLLPVGLASVVCTLTAALFRRRFAAIVVSTLSFLGVIVVLSGGIFSSIAPLLAAVRDMLPPEQRW
jgi:hypothetical protein